MKSRCASSKKKTSLGLSGSPASGSARSQKGQQPEQKRRIELGRVDQLIRSESRQRPVGIGLHHVVEVERRLAEELASALLLERDETALNRPDTCRRDIAVLGLKFLRVIAAWRSIAWRSLRSGGRRLLSSS